MEISTGEGVSMPASVLGRNHYGQLQDNSKCRGHGALPGSTAGHSVLLSLALLSGGGQAGSLSL